jgi:hypothetical protein
MPNRILREGILASEAVERIADQPNVEVFYRRLHSVVDDYGRFSAHPSLLRAALYPLRLDKVADVDVAEYLSACAAAQLIHLYSVDAKPYLEVRNFKQRTRAMKSKYPPLPFDSQRTAECGHPSDKRRSDDGRVRTETETDTEARVGDGGAMRRRGAGTGRNGPQALPDAANWSHAEAFTVAWERHRKHRANQPLQAVAQTFIGRNGSLDWGRLESAHPAYCEYWAARGWDFCGLTLLEWIDAGMPEPPPKPAEGATGRQAQLDAEWERLSQ